jgi:uracil-DNA glycosylase
MTTKKTKLEWKKFEPLFGTWASRIKPFFDASGFDPIYEFLRGEAKRGKQIAPASINTYRVFKETDIRELKAVIVCQDPYAKFINNTPIASGVAMDCSITARVQPTLQQFYNGIEKELYDGLNLEYINTYDLSYLSQQGVLLLNTALTVEKDKPGSHGKVWEDFTIFLLKNVIAPTGVPILFMGKEAGSFEPAVCLTNPTFTVKHPASASYSGKMWDTEGAFTFINKHIWDSNQETILWLNIDPPF